MNGVPEYYEAKFKQSASGVWYCDGFKAVAGEAAVAIDEADESMTKIEKILERHNKKEQPIHEDKWKKAADDFAKGIKAKQPPAKEEK